MEKLWHNNNNNNNNKNLKQFCWVNIKSISQHKTRIYKELTLCHKL